MCVYVFKKCILVIFQSICLLHIYLWAMCNLIDNARSSTFLLFIGLESIVCEFTWSRFSYHTRSRHSCFTFSHIQNTSSSLGLSNYGSYLLGSLMVPLMLECLQLLNWPHMPQELSQNVLEILFFFLSNWKWMLAASIWGWTFVCLIIGQTWGT